MKSLCFGAAAQIFDHIVYMSFWPTREASCAYYADLYKRKHIQHIHIASHVGWP